MTSLGPINGKADLRRGNLNVALPNLSEPDVRDAGFRDVIEAAPDAIVVHRDGSVLYANPAAITRFQARDLPDLQQYHLMDFILAADRPAIVRALEDLGNADKGSRVVGYRCMTLGGEVRDIETVAVNIPRHLTVDRYYAKGVPSKE